VCLLTQTALPITQIAMAAGFGSCRRFNDAFRHTYGRSPRDLRKADRRSGVAGSAEEVVLRLAYRPPYDWSHMREFLAARAIAAVERVDARGYARTVACEGRHALIWRERAPRRGCARAARAGRTAGCVAAARLGGAARVRSCGGSARIGVELATDPLIGPLVRQRPACAFPAPGMRSSARCARCSASK